MIDTPFARFRRSIVNFIIKTKLPGSFWLGMLIQSKQDTEHIRSICRDVVESITQNEVMLKEITAVHPAMARWLTEERLATVPGLRFLVADFVSMVSQGFDLNWVDKVFDQLVTDDQSCFDVVVSFTFIPRFLEESGFKNGEILKDEIDLANHHAKLRMSDYLFGRLPGKTRQQIDEVLVED